MVFKGASDSGITLESVSRLEALAASVPDQVPTIQGHTVAVALLPSHVDHPLHLADHVAFRTDLDEVLEWTVEVSPEVV
jgi:hypothetical protein